MNNRIRSAFFSLAVVTPLLLTACSGTQTDNIPEGPYTAYTTAFTTYATVSPVATNTVSVDSYAVGMDTEGSFRSAVWIAKDRNTESERYYVFLDDTRGKIIEQQNGQETPFTCILSGEEKTFTVGGEGTRPVTVFWTDNDHAVIRWGEERSESLTLLRENASEPLHFFSNEQLCAMAVDYCEKATGIRPAHARTFYNVDEMIAVQLYNNDGTIQDTLDWYTIDRYTAEGYNTLNETICLTEAPEQTASAQTATAPAQTTATPAQTSAPEQTTAAAQTTVFTQPATVAQTLPPRPEIEAAEAQPAEGLPEASDAVTDALF